MFDSLTYQSWLDADAAHLLSVPQHLALNLEAVVVIPARDEAQRIIPCLEGLRCQWSKGYGNLYDRFAAVLVINGTSDATAYQAARWLEAHPTFPLFTIVVEFPQNRAHVGSARRLGLDFGAMLLETAHVPNGLLLSSDADSRLACTAVSAALTELKHVDAFGAHIVAGEPDTSVIGRMINRYGVRKAELRYQHYRQPFERHPQHGVFGGAGFGVRASAYRAVGGLAAVAYDEDQRLRRSLLNAGYRVSYPNDVVVYTSTRLDGRTPWGMAKQLAAWESDNAAGNWPMVPSDAGLTWKYRRKAQARLDWERIGPEGLTFERYWRALWSRRAVQRLLEAKFPLVGLREAVGVLEGVGIGRAA